MKYTSRGQFKVDDKQFVNEMSQKVFSAAGGKRSFILGFIYSTLFFLVGVGAYASRAFLRERIGERTIGVFTILFVYVFLWTAHTLYIVIPDAKIEFQSYVNENKDAIGAYIERMLKSEMQNSYNSGTYDKALVDSYSDLYTAYYMLDHDVFQKIFVGRFLNLLGRKNIGYLPIQFRFFWYMIIFFSIKHFIGIFRRNRRGEQLHSRYRGDSYFFKKLEGKKTFGLVIGPLFIRVVLEPILVIFLSYCIQFVFTTPLLGFIIRISALCLIFEELRVYFENRHMVLDIADSNIDGEYISSIQAQQNFTSSANSISIATTKARIA